MDRSPSDGTKKMMLTEMVSSMDIVTYRNKTHFALMEKFIFVQAIRLQKDWYAEKNVQILVRISKRIGGKPNGISGAFSSEVSSNNLCRPSEVEVSDVEKSSNRIENVICRGLSMPNSVLIKFADCFLILR